MPQQPVSTIVVTQVALVDINREIAEREHYRKQQEAIITQIINDGNNQLLQLNYDIKYARKELRDMKAKLYELASERYTAEEDLRLLKEEIKQTLESSGLYPSFGV
jgi:chromosome segregation ATPase